MGRVFEPGGGGRIQRHTRGTGGRGNGHGMVIEVKYAENGNLSEACERALKQIEERKYNEVFRENGVDHVLKYAIACHKKRCKVMLAEE